jgi:uncharacterized membrane protein
VLALIALVACTALLADVAFSEPTYCGFAAGCERVTSSAYGRPLGVPLPILGLAAFGFLLALTLFPAGRAFALFTPLAVATGAVGIGLIALQIGVLGMVCPLCLVVDVSAVGMAAVALVGHRAGRPPGASWRARAAWLGAAVVAVVAPLFWAWAEIPDPPPEEVRRHWVAGRVTVVEVTDFDCPYCRQADGVLREALAGRDVHFVRLVAPMPRHENGRSAGRAYLAAARQGRGEEMASALSAADTRSPERCRGLAAELKLDLDGYDRVVRDPATDAELDATVAWARTAGPGLPLVWVQDRRFIGALTPEALAVALDRAARKVARE